MTDIIKVKNLTKTFSHKNRKILEIKNINFSIKKGITTALVGQSGCGKTTIAKLLLNLIPKTSGEVLFNGEDIFLFNKRKLKDYRRKAQIIFQNPSSSLNPRMKIKDILLEPLIVHKLTAKEDKLTPLLEILELVGLSKSVLYRYPHEFSGGERQRIAIARAIILKPSFLVLDEPTSALDMPLQSQILFLLKDLQKQFNLTYLFITHHLQIVKNFCDDVLVMHKGQIIEKENTKNIFLSPKHSHTKELINADFSIDNVVSHLFNAHEQISLGREKEIFSSTK